MSNNKGFTITEVLVALLVLMVVAMMLLPLSSFITKEREALSHKRNITYQLHDDLYEVIQNHSSPKASQITYKSVKVTFEFIMLDQSIVKGCATWNSIVNRKEEVCLYGVQK
ncbi:prepilin-type N-terminal cleavage/methylation domain-containing protein [Ornithinibacillus scapharcae]|uniref:prepilin-type N-terminal cleavage/methylation domain-containing protein n=1 Tax=Ornithinibacillus scapharcae TaxID=1147159 RepID=UPI000225B0F3|nr:prepilin-type N-terminal cleavage/methylation domain-containing protein [Ornithinibacillus scapharcae]